MPVVGLITYHHVPNFGAFLQAWAMVQTLRRLGCEVEVIDYRPPQAEAGRRKGLRALLPSPGRWRMHRFMKSQLPLTATFHTREHVADHVQRRGYDCLVCGSDQVWMKDSRRGFDRTYYLDVVRDLPIRRISYAPSCGSMESYGEHGSEVKRILSGFHAISARDERTIRVLTSAGVTNITHVVDPTLLADFSPLTRQPLRQGGYVAVAGPMDEAACRLARYVGNGLKVPIVAIGTRCPGADQEKRFVHPGEWINYLAHADFVVTTLFHGAACSIRLRKPFLASDAGGRGFKLPDLLGRFGLGGRYMERNANGVYELTPELLAMDYTEAEPRIERAVEASLDYLRSALNG